LLFEVDVTAVCGLLLLFEVDVAVVRGLLLLFEVDVAVAVVAVLGLDLWDLGAKSLDIGDGKMHEKRQQNGSVSALDVDTGGALCYIKDPRKAQPSSLLMLLGLMHINVTHERRNEPPFARNARQIAPKLSEMEVIGSQGLAGIRRSGVVRVLCVYYPLCTGSPSTTGGQLYVSRIRQIASWKFGTTSVDSVE
jgi:hypothetical protein